MENSIESEIDSSILKENDNNAKIIIVGDSQVGKTSIITRFVESKFHLNQITTVGNSYYSKNCNIDGFNLKFQIWDTAGQEIYRSLIKGFCKDAIGALVCFDLTDIPSFESIIGRKIYDSEELSPLKHKFKGWINLIKENAREDCVVFLVGTKSDLKGKVVITSDLINSFEGIKNLKYFETSSKANKNINECLFSLGKEIVKKKLYLKDRVSVCLKKSFYDSVNENAGNVKKKREKCCSGN